jgi:hypothetical protein
MNHLLIALQTHGVLLQYLELLTSPAVIQSQDYAQKVVPTLAELGEKYGICPPICMQIIRPMLHSHLLAAALAAEEQERVANEEAEKRLKAALAAKRDPSIANSRIASPAVGEVSSSSSETPVPVESKSSNTQENKSSDDVVMENGDSQGSVNVSSAPEVSPGQLLNASRLIWLCRVPGSQKCGRYSTTSRRSLPRQRTMSSGQLNHLTQTCHRSLICLVQAGFLPHVLAAVHVRPRTARQQIRRGRCSVACAQSPRRLQIQHGGPFFRQDEAPGCTGPPCTSRPIRAVRADARAGAQDAGGVAKIHDQETGKGEDALVFTWPESGRVGVCSHRALHSAALPVVAHGRGLLCPGHQGSPHHGHPGFQHLDDIR